MHGVALGRLHALITAGIAMPALCSMLLCLSGCGVIADVSAEMKRVSDKKAAEKVAKIDDLFRIGKEFGITPAEVGELDSRFQEVYGPTKGRRITALLMQARGPGANFVDELMRKHKDGDLSSISYSHVESSELREAMTAAIEAFKSKPD